MAAVIGLLIWLGVAVAAVGVVYERSGQWDDATVDHSIYAAFWPMFAVFAIGWGVLWSLLWIGRGPVRLVVWMGRPRLPRAEVRR